ncbi:hypothetical protein FRB95_007333 [Tulasnella sp. JGI-2019a]|nr:hypothetical protein FRB95_007333 [Tulasnella sp. JGI-2019a]
MGPKKQASVPSPVLSRQLIVPKKKAKVPEKAVEDRSNALVPYNGKRLPPGTSSRELILYAKEHGGELILARNITGPEKLRLKADALSNAVRAPFNLDELIRIAESQLDQQLGQVDRLRDHTFFYDDVAKTIESRVDLLSQYSSVEKIFQDSKAVASAIGTRIHNTYYVAGSWKQVALLLDELKSLAPDVRPEDLGGEFRRKDGIFRDRYVLLYRQMVALTGILQKNVALAAAASKYYSHYFFAVQSAWMAFRREEAMGAMKSLINTIVMELIFPQSKYPLHILYAILRESLDGSPAEGTRFSQGLFDAIGDLGDAVRLLDMVEAPLSGDWAKLRDTIPPYTPAFDVYIDAEYLSISASENMSPLEPFVKPLTKTQDRLTLDKLWKEVDKVYITISGLNVDATWQLQEERNRPPQWSFVFDKSYLPADDEESDFSDVEDERLKHALVLHKDRKNLKKGGKPGGTAGGALTKHRKAGEPGGGKKKARALTHGEVGIASDEDDPEMPDLVSLSGSADEEQEDLGSDDDDDGGDGWDAESGYDSEEEAELGRMLAEMIREADKKGLDIDDDSEDDIPAPSTKSKPAAPKSKNPFVRLMNQLGGRLFSLDPTLNSQGPRKRDKGAVNAADAATKKAAAKPAAPKPKVSQTLPSLERQPGLHYIPAIDRDPKMPQLEVIRARPKEAPTSDRFRTTLEEVEEDEEKDQKKKRTRNKKKKKTGDEVAAPPTMSPRAQAMASTTSLASTTTTASPKPRPKKQVHASSDTISAAAVEEYKQAWSTSLHQPSHAMSSRVYLAAEGLVDAKEKKKTKRDTEPISEDREPPNKEGFGAKISNLFRKKDKGAEALVEKKEKVEEKPAATVPFVLGAKVMKVMNKMFHPKDQAVGSMKWDHFVRAMQKMGFTYHPDTAGSSVRFDPPDVKDGPITFHKPHPDSTLHSHHLRDFRKRLERQYGWTAANFDTFDRGALGDVDGEEVD